MVDASSPVDPDRFHKIQAKVSECELEQNLAPCKIKKDTDWAENGEIIVKDQMQSECWHTKYYSPPQDQG